MPISPSSTSVSLKGDPSMMIGVSRNPDAAIDAIIFYVVSVAASVIISEVTSYSIGSIDTTDIIILSVLSVENTPLA